MNSAAIRSGFLEYFKSKGHAIVASSSLVPANDPTLLFTNAGMNQFKDVFLGQEKRDYTAPLPRRNACVRAASITTSTMSATRRATTRSSRCWAISLSATTSRATPSHYAWELITNGYGLPKDRLYVTVFREDDEAEELWQEVAGVARKTASSVWTKTTTSGRWATPVPAVLHSEIHYDLGPAPGAGPHPEDPTANASSRSGTSCSCSSTATRRGTLTPLPRPSVDTGMGLERMAAVCKAKLRTTRPT